MTIYLANGTAVSLMAREMAPLAATRDMFRFIHSFPPPSEHSNSNFSNSSSKLGPRSAGVPGEIKGYWEAKSKFGNPAISWSELIQPTIDICNEGITKNQFQDLIDKTFQVLECQLMLQMH